MCHFTQSTNSSHKLQVMWCTAASDIGRVVVEKRGAGQGSCIGHWLRLRNGPEIGIFKAGFGKRKKLLACTVVDVECLVVTQKTGERARQIWLLPLHGVEGLVSHRGIVLAILGVEFVEVGKIDFGSWNRARRCGFDLCRFTSPSLPRGEVPQNVSDVVGAGVSL